MSFQWPIRVYVEDTDLGGIAYHANYLKFMERARAELLRHIGYGQQQLAQDDILFLVTGIDSRYLKPARLDDEILVGVEVERTSGARVTFLQKIIRSSDSVLLFQARVDIACVSATRLKPRRWPASMLDQLISSTVQQLTTEE